MKEKYFTFININSKSETILNELKVIGNKKKIVFNPMKSALIVLDMQEYFLNKKSHAFIPSAEIIIPQIQKLIHTYLLNGLTVIATKHINTNENAKMMGLWWSDIIKEESEYSQIKSELLKKDMIVLTKSQYDAFYNTDLDKILREKSISQIVVCGVMTHLCCESTIRSAFTRGYKCFYPINGTATYNYQFHKSSFINLSHGFAVPVLISDILKQFDKKS